MCLWKGLMRGRRVLLHRRFCPRWYRIYLVRQTIRRLHFLLIHHPHLGFCLSTPFIRCHLCAGMNTLLRFRRSTRHHLHLPMYRPTNVRRQVCRLWSSRLQLLWLMTPSNNHRLILSALMLVRLLWIRLLCLRGRPAQCPSRTNVFE